jgi:ribosomal protein L16/L10AE
VKTDAQLKNDVVAELRWDPTVTSSDINVATHAGVVTLSGTVLQYETEVKTGKLLLDAHGTPDEVELAKELLDKSSAKATIHAEPIAAGA